MKLHVSVLQRPVHNSHSRLPDVFRLQVRVEGGGYLNGVWLSGPYDTATDAEASRPTEPAWTRDGSRVSITGVEVLSTNIDIAMLFPDLRDADGGISMHIIPTEEYLKELARFGFPRSPNTLIWTDPATGDTLEFSRQSRSWICTYEGHSCERHTAPAAHRALIGLRATAPNVPTPEAHGNLYNHKILLNDAATVTLTARGAEIWNQDIASIIGTVTSDAAVRRLALTQRKAGHKLTIPLWDLMRTFGSSLMNGVDSPFVDGVIRIQDRDVPQTVATSEASS